MWFPWHLYKKGIKEASAISIGCGIRESVDSLCRDRVRY